MGPGAPLEGRGGALSTPTQALLTGGSQGRGGGRLPRFPPITSSITCPQPPPLTRPFPAVLLGHPLFLPQALSQGPGQSRQTCQTARSLPLPGKRAMAPLLAKKELPTDLPPHPAPRPTPTPHPRRWDPWPAATPSARAKTLCRLQNEKEGGPTIRSLRKRRCASSGTSLLQGGPAGGLRQQGLAGTSL